jgi:hypothetical protein
LFRKKTVSVPVKRCPTPRAPDWWDVPRF